MSQPLARSFVAFGTTLILTACSTGTLKMPGAPAADNASKTTIAQNRSAQSRAVCPDTHKSDVAHCLALIRTDLPPSQTPYGYTPPDLQSAYNLPSSADGAGQTVAIIDAYDDPKAEADLFIYRNYFGLPVCSTLNGCFKKLNQHGKKRPLPPPDQHWSIEIALDIDMVSAACPNCNIMLVEATSNKWHDLEKAVDEAVKLGATIVSNSYGGYNGAHARFYSHSGVVIVAAGGDSGYYGPFDLEPAGFPTVVAVGGTTLTPSSGSRGWTETVWSGTGSGCPSFKKPPWQTDTGCKHRTTNDVAAVADRQRALRRTTATRGRDGSKSVAPASARRSTPRSSPSLGMRRRKTARRPSMNRNISSI